jgi:A/G-specific adenine glycosylase
VPEHILVRPVLRHGFTHFDLDMTPLEVHLPTAPARLMDGNRWLWYNVRQPAQVGLAAPVSRLLASLARHRSRWPRLRALPRPAWSAHL